VEEHPAVQAMQKLAAELQVYIPTSFFEADGHHHYNSLAMIDDKGAVMGVYRKSHIPDGPGYSEKFYFRPGNTGFKTFRTPYGTVGPAVCWDQWYPETARSLMLTGAEILLFPTAIGTEPHDPDLDTSRMWRRAMIGHAVSNVVPVVAANRIGTEAASASTATASSATSAATCWRSSARGDGRPHRHARPGSRPAPTAPPSASSATAGRSFTGGSARTSERASRLIASSSARAKTCSNISA
jgi:predicted amidohydrolase